MNAYKLVLLSDNGEVTLYTFASSITKAKELICKIELCPMSAILSCVQVKSVMQDIRDN